MEGLGKTIRNGKGFERVRLTPDEMDAIHDEVMDYNIAVVRECIAKTDEEFNDLEPERRLRVALLLAERATVHRFTLEKEALESKVSAIKDEMNGNGKGQAAPAASPKRLGFPEQSKKEASQTNEAQAIYHTVSRIASNPHEYQYCDECGVINRLENKRCHECGATSFNPMDADDAACLLRDWKGEEDFKLPVAREQDAQPTNSDLKRGFSEEVPMEHRDDAPKPGEIIDGFEVVSSYSTKQAVEDGVLVPVGNVWGAPVYMTANLFSKYEEEQRRRDLVSRGLGLLSKPDPEDTPYMKLRVIEKDRAWVIQEPGKFTYMEPSDY